MSVMRCAQCDSYSEAWDSCEETNCPERPAAPDATAGDGLREVQRRLADELVGHAGNLGPRDPSQPNVWLHWCACGKEFGRYSEDHGHRYRLHVAEALLALPALRDVLAAAARDAAKVRRVEELLARYRYPTREGLLAALDPS